LRMSDCDIGAAPVWKTWRIFLNMKVLLGA